MITVPEAVEKIIKRSRYLSEALSKELINTSSLARYIQPEVEEILLKPVSNASLIMAINRLTLKKPIQQKYKQLLKNPPDMTVRSNLHLLYIENSSTLKEKLFHIKNTTTQFFTITEGVSETTIIFNNSLEDEVQKHIAGEKILFRFTNLSAITLHLPKEAVTTPGVYYFFLKSLAWEEVNIIEIISTYHEISLFFSDEDINRAFMLLKGLFITEKL